MDSAVKKSLEKKCLLILTSDLCLEFFFQLYLQSFLFFLAASSIVSLFFTSKALPKGG